MIQPNRCLLCPLPYYGDDFTLVRVRLYFNAKDHFYPPVRWRAGLLCLSAVHLLGMKPPRTGNGLYQPHIRESNNPALALGANWQS
jgi:hypothetical protein